jgi:hypothetical protein
MMAMTISPAMRNMNAAEAKAMSEETNMAFSYPSRLWLKQWPFQSVWP